MKRSGPHRVTDTGACDSICHAGKSRIGPPMTIDLNLREGRGDHQRYYNQAQTIDAARRYQAFLLGLRNGRMVEDPELAES